MNKMSGWKKFFGCLVVGLTMTGGAFAQQLAGVSFTYEMFPLNTWGSVAAFPLILAQGKTILVSAVEYQNTVYDFEDWGYAQGSTGDTERFHAVGYSLLAIQQLPGAWSLVANVRPHLSSDFGSDLTVDDFALKSMLVFMYSFGDTLSLGPGLMYSLRDWPLFPLPFLRFEWKPSPSINIEGVIPDNVTALYAPRPFAQVGVFARTTSANHHGDPAVYGTDNTWLAYSDLTLGPTARFHYKKWFHVTVEGGYSTLRRFHVYENNRREETIDLDGTAYLKTAVLIGM